MGYFSDRMSLRLPRTLDIREWSSIHAVTIPATIILGYASLKWFGEVWHKRNLQRKVRARCQLRAEQFNQIAERIQNIDENFIGNLKIEELLAKLKNGEISCSNVLKVYQKKALRANDGTNSITEFIMEANKLAEELDEKAKNPEYVKPPLFGLPISLKANIGMKGRDQIRGYAQDLENPLDEDAVIVKHLRALGAVPFVLTNVPMSLLTFSCENPIFGSTKNPHSSQHSSGGSSGGEGALIGNGGSIIGIGSDIGGSIRIPASFCGIVGFKPYSRRVSNIGSPGSVPGRSHVYGALGPMAADVRGCVELLRALWSSDWISREDCYSSPTPFREELYSSTKPLRIGYFDSDPWLEPVPAMQRAVSEARSRLKALGHELVPIRPPPFERAFQLFMTAVTLDNGRYLQNMIDNDLPVAGYSKMLFIPRRSYYFRKLLSLLIRPLSHRASVLIGTVNYDCSTLRQSFEDIDNFCRKWNVFVNEEKLDAFICPAFPTAAMSQKEPYELVFTVIYTAIFNLLDYAAGTLPIGKVTAEDIKALDSYDCGDLLGRKLKASAQRSLGLPVGIQVVALPHRDEVALRIMRELEDSIRNNSST